MANEHPRPVADDWRHQAACATTRPEIFIPDDGNYDQARTICAACPVADACLEDAMARNEKQGMWGGLAPHERRNLRRSRRREAARAS